MVYAGFGGVLVLVAILMSSFFVLDRGMDLVVLRARQRILDNLPAELGPPERRRTERNLQHFVLQLQRDVDRTPLMGEFIDRVASFVEDEVLTVDEVRNLNRFLESSTGPPGALVAPPAVRTMLASEQAVAAEATATTTAEPTAPPLPTRGTGP